MLAKIGMDYPKNSLLEIIDELGVDVYLVDFEENYPGISGVVDKESIPPKIYLNKKHSKTRQTFTLAHELGHYILHDGCRYRIDQYEYGEEGSAEETEANYFAASLLVPEDKLQKISRETNDISVIAQYFGVSDSVVKVRINWIKTN